MLDTNPCNGLECHNITKHAKDMIIHLELEA